MPSNSSHSQTTPAKTGHVAESVALGAHDSTRQSPPLPPPSPIVAHKSEGDCDHSGGGYGSVVRGCSRTYRHNPYPAAASSSFSSRSYNSERLALNSFGNRQRDLLEDINNSNGSGRPAENLRSSIHTSSSSGADEQTFRVSPKFPRACSNLPLGAASARISQNQEHRNLCTSLLSTSTSSATSSAHLQNPRSADVGVHALGHPTYSQIRTMMSFSYVSRSPTEVRIEERSLSEVTVAASSTDTLDTGVTHFGDSGTSSPCVTHTVATTLESLCETSPARHIRATKTAHFSLSDEGSSVDRKLKSSSGSKNSTQKSSHTSASGKSSASSTLDTRAIARALASRGVFVYVDRDGELAASTLPPQTPPTQQTAAPPPPAQQPTQHHYHYHFYQYQGDEVVSQPIAYVAAAHPPYGSYQEYGPHYGPFAMPFSDAMHWQHQGQEGFRPVGLGSASQFARLGREVQTSSFGRGHTSSTLNYDAPSFEPSFLRREERHAQYSEDHNPTRMTHQRGVSSHERQQHSLYQSSCRPDGDFFGVLGYDDHRDSVAKSTVVAPVPVGGEEHLVPETSLEGYKFGAYPHPSVQQLPSHSHSSPFSSLLPPPYDHSLHCPYALSHHRCDQCEKGDGGEGAPPTFFAKTSATTTSIDSATSSFRRPFVSDLISCPAAASFYQRQNFHQQHQISRLLNEVRALRAERQKQQRGYDEQKQQECSEEAKVPQNCPTSNFSFANEGIEVTGLDERASGESNEEISQGAENELQLCSPAGLLSLADVSSAEKVGADANALRVCNETIHVDDDDSHHAAAALIGELPENTPTIEFALPCSLEAAEAQLEHSSCSSSHTIIHAHSNENASAPLAENSIISVDNELGKAEEGNTHHTSNTILDEAEKVSDSLFVSAEFSFPFPPFTCVMIGGGGQNGVSDKASADFSSAAADCRRIARFPLSSVVQPLGAIGKPAAENTSSHEKYQAPLLGGVSPDEGQLRVGEYVDISFYPYDEVPNWEAPIAALQEALAQVREKKRKQKDTSAAESARRRHKRSGGPAFVGIDLSKQSISAIYQQPSSSQKSSLNNSNENDASEAASDNTAIREGINNKNISSSAYLRSRAVFDLKPLLSQCDRCVKVGGVIDSARPATLSSLLATVFNVKILGAVKKGTGMFVVVLENFDEDYPRLKQMDERLWMGPSSAFFATTDAAHAFLEKKLSELRSIETRVSFPRHAMTFVPWVPAASHVRTPTKKEQRQQPKPVTRTGSLVPCETLQKPSESSPPQHENRIEISSPKGNSTPPLLSCVPRSPETAEATSPLMEAETAPTRGSTTYTSIKSFAEALLAGRRKIAGARSFPSHTEGESAFRSVATATQQKKKSVSPTSAADEFVRKMMGTKG